MLDQYQGTLICVVNYNDGSFAECDIVDAVSINSGASIDDEFWLGLSRVQVHAETLGLTEEQFLAQYPVGRTFRNGAHGAGHGPGSLHGRWPQDGRVN